MRFLHVSKLDALREHLLVFWKLERNLSAVGGCQHKRDELFGCAKLLVPNWSQGEPVDTDHLAIGSQLYLGALFVWPLGAVYV